MKRRGVILKSSAVAILFTLLVASAGQADIAFGEETRALWEDHFTDTSKIDSSPPGQGLSDNYVVSSSKVKMANTCSAWTDPAWTRMKPITITNSAGQVLTKYALKITISYDSDMQSDYRDLRFKHADSPSTYLGYWIESYDASAAQVWINIPSLAIGSSTVYMFYGNSVATSESDFADVFSDWNEQWSTDEKVTLHADNEGTWDPDVAYGNSEFLVAWEEGQAYYPPYTFGFKQEIRASIYDTSGNKLVDDKQVFNDGTFYYRNEDPSIAYGGSKYFVAWEHFDTVANPGASTMDIYARTVQRSGSNLVLGTVINVCVQSNCQADPNVAFDSVNNRFCVVWEDARLGTTDYNIYGRLYDTSGNPVGGEKTIASAVNSQCEPWVAYNPTNQQYMIVWEDGETANNGPFDIYMCRFDLNLVQIGSPVKLADGSASIDYNFPCVAFNQETLQYLVTWNSGDISAGDWRGDVYGIILDASGNTVVPTFVISAGNYVRTDIAVHPMTNMNDLYFVSYDDNSKIWGKFVTASGEPSTNVVQLSASSSAQADWANIAIGNGKIFVAWEDIRVTYPSQYDMYPDVFANMWNLETQFGLSVSYAVGAEQSIVLLAHVTSISIQKGSGSTWGQFNAVSTGSAIAYSVLDGVTGAILVSSITPGSNIGVTAESIRLMATFTRTNPSGTPELDYWSVSWLVNNPPNAPSSPNPVNGATGVNVNAALSWSCSDPDGDSLTYDVYFDDESPPALVSPGQAATTYDPPGAMTAGVTYYWKIVAFDEHGASTAGPIWSFTTWINHPPSAPNNPNPTNGATGVGVDVVVSWSCSDPDGDPLTFDVYFGDSTPPGLVSSGQTATTYDPYGDLQFGVTYYWQIVAFDTFSASNTSPIWSFTTVENDPPYTPGSPQPTDGETGVAIDHDLSWTGGDPDGDTVTYDVYFGMTSPPPLNFSGYTSTTYDPGTMKFETTYYWQIIAEDEHGATSDGLIWSFTTAPNQPPYEPSNPTPDDGATDIPVDTLLMWDGGDPNSGDIVTYDIFFDVVNPPALCLERDWTEESYHIQDMSYDTIYYWQIVAKDNNGGSTDGPVWSFTTELGQQNSPPSTPTIKGSMLIKPNKEYEYTIQSTDPEGEQIYYKISWGNEYVDWFGPYDSGEEVVLSHTWTEAWKPYLIMVYAKDSQGNKNTQAGTLPILVPKNAPIYKSIILRLLENRLLFNLFTKILYFIKNK